MPQIKSLTRGRPAVSIQPTLPAWQAVRLNGSIKDWKFNRTGRDTYRLSIGGYAYTGIVDGKVTASIYAEHDVKWKFEYHENHDAYTISPANNPSTGWTISGDQITVEPIIVRESFPPQYSANQLFRY